MALVLVVEKDVGVVLKTALPGQARWYHDRASCAARLDIGRAEGVLGLGSVAARPGHIEDRAGASFAYERVEVADILEAAGGVFDRQGALLLQHHIVEVLRLHALVGLAFVEMRA